MVLIVATVVIWTIAAAMTVVRCSSVTVRVMDSGPIPTFLLNVLRLPEGFSDGRGIWARVVEVDASTTLTGGSAGIVEGETETTGDVGEGESRVVLGKLKVVGDVGKGTEVDDGIKDTDDDTVGNNDVSVVVVLNTVVVVKGGRIKVDVVVVRSVLVVVVLDDIGELCVDGGISGWILVVDDEVVVDEVSDGSLVGGASVVVVSVPAVVEVIVHAATLAVKLYCQPVTQLSGSPQQIPARRRYTPGSRFTSIRDIKLPQSSLAVTNWLLSVYSHNIGSVHWPSTLVVYATNCDGSEKLNQ